MRGRFALSAILTAAAVAGLLGPGPAGAEPPLWVAANGVTATHTECGGESFLLLRGPGVKAPPPPSRPGCTSSEEAYYELDVAAAFVSKGGVAETNVDASTLSCDNRAGVMILGRSRDIELAIRRLPAPPRGCSYAKRRYQRVTSEGSIPFKNVVARQMSVSESLAMHQKERDQIIRECNANAACRAEVARRRASSGNRIYTCPPGYVSNGAIDNPYATCRPSPP
ncbi:MAG: hypothetical protein ABI699_02590 [Caldimonas sp.]